ncbi:MAG: DUF512 domain-containing protein [Eubacteriaceae bacterium]|nr:DUF512 domain-containing protein [Eubacteriaceae bacterium]
MGKIVTEVEPGSLAERYGIAPGMVLEAINGMHGFDVLDYIEACGEEVVRFEFKGIGELAIENVYGCTMGLAFANATIQPLKQCKNRCVFCFVDQLPKGLRKSLYVKDDDYRLSFLSGNYVTLTNLLDCEIDRIIKMGLSPLYVSVHATDPSLREKMLGNKRAGGILSMLSRLGEAGIRLNLQFVLCPGLNDGQALIDSFESLMPLMPFIDSAACVPVGLTNRRKGLYPLRLYRPREAAGVLLTVDRYRRRAMAACGRAVFAASDEFYLLAGKKLPNESYYEGYPQYEDGVGVAASFLKEAKRQADLASGRDFRGLDAALATGVLAYPLIGIIARRFERRAENLRLEAVAVPNALFGAGVTAAGLVAGEDLADRIGAIRQPEVIIPSCMLSDEGLFLDGLSVEGLQKKTGKRVTAAPFGGSGLLGVLMGLRPKKGGM